VKGGGQTGAALVLDGATANVAGWLKAGDWIQLGSAGSARLHKVLADAASDGTGTVTLDLWPEIQSAPADNSVVVVQGARGVFRLVANQQGYDVDETRFYGLVLAMRSEP
jgi:hypothetical protein